MHNAWKNIRILCIESTSILLWRKDCFSITHDRTFSFFTKHPQLFVFRKLFGWKLEKSYTRKCMRFLVSLHRSLWNASGKENWVQNTLNDVKLFNNSEVLNQTNQIQVQIMMERRNPLVAVTQVSSKVTSNVERGWQHFKGSHDRFLKHLNLVHPCSNMIEMRMLVVHGTFLQNKITPVECQNQNTFTTGKIDGSLNKSGNTGPLRNRSDFNEALSTLNRLHQESGERPLRHMPFWKYSQWQQSSSLSSSRRQLSVSWLFSL